jgi:hypothetical protein
MSKQRREHEQLDIDEMERRVARALLAVVDAPGERQAISAKLLAQRTQLPLRRVREITDAWELRTLSGDELWLGSGSVGRVRARLEELG